MKKSREAKGETWDCPRFRRAVENAMRVRALRPIAKSIDSLSSSYIFLVYHHVALLYKKRVKFIS